MRSSDHSPDVDRARSSPDDPSGGEARPDRGGQRESGHDRDVRKREGSSDNRACREHDEPDVNA
jgi:hypothetical protein